MFEALKVIVFAVALVTAVFSRRWSLAIAAFFLPLATLLPSTSIAGLNTLNMLLLPVIMHAFLAGEAPKTPKRRDPFLIPMTILLVMVFGSLLRVQFSSELPVEFLATQGHYRNIMVFKGMVLVVILYWCSRRLVKDEATFRFAIMGTVGGYLVSVITGTVDVLGGVGLQDRAGGHFGHSGSLGHYLAAYTMFPTAALLMGAHARLFIGAVVATAFSVMGIMGSLSRGALLSFGAGVSSMATVRRSVWMVVLAAAVLTAPLWLPQNYMARFKETVKRDPTGLSSVPGFQSAEEFQISKEARAKIWRSGVRMVADKPIIGVGYGQFSYSLKQYGYEGSLRLSAHNVPLALAAECGVLTALAHIANLLILGNCALRLTRAARGKTLTTFGLGMFGATVAFAVSGMVIPHFYNFAYSGAYFILAGALVNTYYSEEIASSIEIGADPKRGDSAAV